MKHYNQAIKQHRLRVQNCAERSWHPAPQVRVARQDRHYDGRMRVAKKLEKKAERATIEQQVRRDLKTHVCAT